MKMGFNCRNNDFQYAQKGRLQKIGHDKDEKEIKSWEIQKVIVILSYKASCRIENLPEAFPFSERLFNNSMDSYRASQLESSII